jgi:hypothetical protein
LGSFQHGNEDLEGGQWIGVSLTRVQMQVTGAESTTLELETLSMVTMDGLEMRKLTLTILKNGTGAIDEYP